MNWLDVFAGVNESDGSNQPIYLRIVERIRAGIESDRLTDRMKLPTSRELSALLRIDRSTVSRAYLELERAGLLESHVGRGTYLSLSGQPASESISDDFRLRSMLWSEKYSRASQTAFGILSRQPVQLRADEHIISFSGGIPSEEFYPYEEFQDIVQQMIQSDRWMEMFGYSPAEGHLGLRAEVSKYLAQQNVIVRDDELLIVSGSQQGIDVVTNTLIDSGDVVLMEEPTYFWAICNFASSQARCLPVPVDEDGLKVDALESILSRHRAKLLYTIPTFQNPTGTSLSLPRRQQLLDLARKHQLAILEDNFVGDLRYDGQDVPSLRSLDTRGDTVIHQGTFSKALCPGLRLGWLVAPAEVMSRLRLSKRASDLSTNSMAQAVMAEYLRSGYYKKHLQHVREVYRSRRDAMCSALTKYIGKSLQWRKPEGGMFVWAKLPAGYSSRELLNIAERHGVTFSSGDMFSINGEKSEYLRLSFIQNDEKTIERGVEKLGAAVKSYTESRRFKRASSSHEAGGAALI